MIGYFCELVEKVGPSKASNIMLILLSLVFQDADVLEVHTFCVKVFPSYGVHSYFFTDL